MARIKGAFFYLLVLWVSHWQVRAEDLKEFIDPPVLSSSEGLLSVVLTAQSGTIDSLQGVTGAYVFSACPYQNLINGSCLRDAMVTNPYGGVRLQLSPGDTFKVHLINQLPSTVELPSGSAFLQTNPTNLHTHGLLVAPAWPSIPSDVADGFLTSTPRVFGDSIFVMSQNPFSNTLDPEPDPDSHVHGGLVVKDGVTDYEISIPASHPSGVDWFHPHVHGLSSLQISHGLSGMITIGSITDVVPDIPEGVDVKHLILKDIQVDGGNEVINEYRSTFCQGMGSLTGLNGYCVGGYYGGRDNTEGKWYFTLSGQKYPNLTVPSAGSIWRFLNASAGATYELQIVYSDGPSAGKNMLFQVISIDGVGVTPKPIRSDSSNYAVAGGHFKTIKCPDAPIGTAICTDSLHMMPGSRADIWIVNRNENGKIIPGAGGHAVLRTPGYNTGFTGDRWPAVHLAQLTFQKGQAEVPKALIVTTSPQSELKDLFGKIAENLFDANQAVGPNTDTRRNCSPLPEGWTRRFFLGYPFSGGWGFGYELVDQNGVPVKSSFQDVASYPDSAMDPICVTMLDSKVTVENWEVINLTREDHNFHVHQTRFAVKPLGQGDGEQKNLILNDALQDSVMIPSGGSKCSGSVMDWRKGACKVQTVKIAIPFAIAGDFPFHCHILEHQDGGMMGIIHVSNGR